MRPNFCLTVLKNDTFCSHLETSALMNMAESFPSFETASSPWDVFISIMATFHPFEWRSLTRANPMPFIRFSLRRDIPDAPPVTIATFPVICELFLKMVWGGEEERLYVRFPSRTPLMWVPLCGVIGISFR